MCGRFNFTAEEAAEIQEIIKETQARLYEMKTGEVSPTNSVPVLVPDGLPRIMRWGFPHWQKSGVIINARSETVTEKKMFRESVLTRRCVIPSTGFYEWSRKDGQKTKYLFRQPGANALYMAGFWNSFPDETGQLAERFVILTTAANNSMLEDTGELSLFPEDMGRRELIHDRMPVVLAPGEVREWLSPGVEFDKLFQREHMELRKTVA